MTNILRTDRLILRRPAPRDYPAWEAFIQDDRSRYVRREATVAAAWRAFCHILGHWDMRGFGLFVFTLKDDGRALGAVGPWYPAEWPERELGWSVWSAADEGAGLAREAAKAARAHAFGNLGWDTAVSYIDPANARSIALAERLGAVLDPDAKTPGDDACLVYRHPKPEGTS